jgi:hypothetical protein
VADVFENFSTTLVKSATTDLMTLQLVQGSLDDADTPIVSDPIIPDRNVIDRLGHLDPDLYDLSDNSHLMKLFQVLLGGAGAGGIRKLIAVARLQNSFRGMHFLDLDRFYGALFGIRRTKAELMPDFGTLTDPARFDPYVDATGSDQWDDVHSRDASYRDRLVKFARALPLGGTYPGVKAAAEALFSVDCEIYESWALIDEQIMAERQPPVSVYTWDSVTGKYPTYAAAADGNSWTVLDGGATLPGGYFVGRTNQQNRSEVLIQPKRPAGDDELFEATRVLGRIAPASAQVMVDPNGVAIHREVPVRNAAASSEYWEIIYKVNPKPDLVNPDCYIEKDRHRCQPRPCFSRYQGEKWCYNNDIDHCRSYEYYEGRALTADNNERISFASGNGRTYDAQQGLMDGAQALAARVVADGVMTSFAYAGRAFGNGTTQFARSYR